jgi:hypothetical protein
MDFQLNKGLYSELMEIQVVDQLNSRAACHTTGSNSAAQTLTTATPVVHKCFISINAFGDALPVVQPRAPKVNILFHIYQSTR